MKKKKTKKKPVGSKMIEVRPGDHMMDALRYGVIEVQKRQPKPCILWTLYRLWRVWRQCPQLRLGQLIDNSVYGQGNRVDLFTIFDEALIERIDNFVKVQL